MELKEIEKIIVNVIKRNNVQFGKVRGEFGTVVIQHGKPFELIADIKDSNLDIEKRIRFK